ncbi:MAG: helix-turn-helix transcriptional regulator [Lachnospiraceae bacterium]|nr:helix-turn-helix transcriptional regulator [Lachnospiraceae bacterium]
MADTYIFETFDKNELIDKLAYELPVLRARINMSQEEVSDLIGVSRQTYSSIETRKRRMMWGTYMSLLFVFYYNPETVEHIESLGLFPDELKNKMSVNHRKQ